jgi:CDP-diacylglycerol--glycerol-3-phosphate 3-phosphatidyltransferase
VAVTRTPAVATNLNLPNALSVLRLLLAPVLLWCAHRGLAEPFLWLLALALATDALDGHLARRLDLATPLGARLDSWGDLSTYAAMVFGLMWLWPAVFAREAWFLYLALGFYLIPTLTSLLKFRELPRYHTWAAKLSAILMAPAYYLLVLYDVAWLFRVVVLFHIWVAIEELIITIILSRRHHDVPTLFHAREIMRRQREALNTRMARRRDRRVAKQDTRRGRSG